MEALLSISILYLLKKNFIPPSKEFIPFFELLFNMEIVYFKDDK